MQNHFGRYEIIDELGRGAMGIVYKAKDPLIERFVAIKSINLQSLPEKQRDEYSARFFREAKAAGHLNHPNIVTIHDLGGNGDMAYIAMELMEGRELQVVMDGVHRLPAEKSLNIIAQVAAGLFYAHQRGIVHRDIKPSNIMLLGGGHVKIADFGIAQMDSSLSLTHADQIMGSPLYMSPEQVMGKTIDARSDIFSLGIVLYQMLTGRRPFTGDNANAVMYQIVNVEPPKPSSINPELPKMLDNIVSKCLAKEPHNRYLNAGELEQDLRTCRESLMQSQAGIENPFMSGTRFSFLNRIATPGSISQTSVAIASISTLFVLFAAGMMVDSEIQTHMLYLFPIALISYHCERIRLVNTAVLLALFFQGTVLALDSDLAISARLALATFVLPSNLMVVYLARVARRNFMEVISLMSFDRMTGLRNRLSFEAMIEKEIERQKQQEGHFSFAYIDIDKLMELNESKGFLAGDEAIKLIANVVRDHERSFDTASRLSGSEFAILMPNTKADDCKLLCAELISKITSKISEAALPLSARIGSVTFEQAPVSISEVFHKAEAAILGGH